MKILARLIAWIWPGHRIKKEKKGSDQLRREREYGAKIMSARRKAALITGAENQRQAQAAKNCFGIPDRNASPGSAQKTALGPEEIEILQRQKEEVEVYKTFFPEIAEWIEPIGLCDLGYHPNAFTVRSGYDEGAMRAFIDNCWEGVIFELGTEKLKMDEFLCIKTSYVDLTQRVWVSDALIWCYVRKNFTPKTLELDSVKETFLVLNRAGWSTFRISRAAIIAKTPQEIISKYWHLANESKKAI